MSGGAAGMLKGITGLFDIGRSLWAGGGVSFIVSSVAFQGYSCAQGHPFDATAYCIGFGTGFAAILAAGGFGVAQKDKGVATAAATVTAASAPENG